MDMDYQWRNDETIPEWRSRIGFAREANQEAIDLAISLYESDDISTTELARRLTVLSENERKLTTAHQLNLVADMLMEWS